MKSEDWRTHRKGDGARNYGQESDPLGSCGLTRGEMKKEKNFQDRKNRNTN